MTTRLCLDRLRKGNAAPTMTIAAAATAPDPADDVALAQTVGVALHVVLERLTPLERVAFVLFDFTFDNGVVRSITFRAEPELLTQLTRRDGKERHG